MKEPRKDRTRREIMEAAKAIVHEKGHGSLTVRHVAEMTGYAHTNLYYYFKDLESLLWSLRLDMIEDMIVELQACPLERGDPIDEVVEAFTCYAGYFLDHPNVFRFFYFHTFVQPEADERYQALEKRLQGNWQTTFRRLLEEGVIRVENLETVAKTIIYALQGMIMLRLTSGSDVNRGELQNELSEIIRYLLAKRP